MSNPFRYRSYYFDNESNLYYLNSRYYDPEIGRFINADDIAEIDPETINGINLYAYCLNNPNNYIDNEGNKPKWWQSILIGLGIIVGAALIATAITFTGGTAAAFFGMWGTSVVGGLKIAMVAGITAGIIRAGSTAIDGGFWSDVGKSLVIGFTDGFLSGSIFVGSTMILSAGAFRISGMFNNGYGWSASGGKWMSGYQTPSTPGISILTRLGGTNGGRSFGIDLDIFNSLHFHTNKFGIGKKSKWIKAHHWYLAPLMLGISIGFNDAWSEW